MVPAPLPGPGTSGPCANPASAAASAAVRASVASFRAQSLRELLRRRHAIAARDQCGDLVPIRFAIEAHAYPAFMADVRRPEEGICIGADQHRLAALGRLEPDREPAVATLLHREDLAAHAIGRIAPSL